MLQGTHFSENFNSAYGDDTTFLEKTVQDYPVSPLPAFLLLQKYKQTNDERYHSLAKKTALFFSNPYWLKFQLLQPEIIEEFIAEAPDKTISTQKLESAYQEDQPAPEAEDDFTQTEENTKSGIAMKDKPEEVPGKDTQHTEEPAPQETKTPGSLIIQTPQTDSLLKTFRETPVPEGTDQPDDNSVVVSSEEEFSDNPVSEIPLFREEETDNAEEQTGNVHFQKELSAQESEVTGEMTQQFDINPEENKESSPALPEEEALEFEPLHTVDYFASQGIIIREEALLNDKLGKQVKSFTDWLKTMKKLHPGKLPEQNEVVEKIIQSSAELSNEDAGVLTEAMAEVLLKQGKREKAIEMYEKLSLMNPAKSTYFAAKIAHLKI